MDEWVARLETCIERANMTLSPGQGSLTKLPPAKCSSNVNTSIGSSTFFGSAHKVVHRDRLEVQMTADSVTETVSKLHNTI